MGLHFRNLLPVSVNVTTPDIIFNATAETCLQYCRDTASCPLICEDYCFDGCGVVYDHQVSRPKKLLLAIILVAGIAFFLVSCYAMYRKYFKKSTSRSSSPPPQEEERLETTHDEFWDEEHGPVIDHPIWHIRTVGLQPAVISSISVWQTQILKRIHGGGKHLLLLHGSLGLGSLSKPLGHLLIVTEVVADVISSINMVEWFQSYALEQLTELTTHLYKLLIGGLKSITENVALANSVLNIMISTMKMSQKRKIYQPHLTLSFEGLFHIYQASTACATGRSSSNSELGLKAILMSIPPTDVFHMNQANVTSFLLWAVSTAVNSDSGAIFHVKESNHTIISDEVLSEESLTSKLLRWLVASVILGKLSSIPNKANDNFAKRSTSKTLQSLLEYMVGFCEKSNEYKNDSQDILAATIVYLQQLLGTNGTVLPSVVSALCLLHRCDAAETSVFTHCCGTSGAPLCSKIRYPAEANPSWRWSFFQPWKDLSSELSDLEKLDEYHACQTLLMMFLKTLGKKSLDSQVLSYKDVDISATFKWERSIVQTDS